MTTVSARLRTSGAALLLFLSYAVTTGSPRAAAQLSSSLSSASSQRGGTASRQLTVSPASMSFGTVTVGASASRPATLSASGANVKVSSATINSNEFTITGIAFPVTIRAGRSVPFTVTFAPQLSGTASGIISFTSNAANSSTQTLSGSGAAPPQHSVSLSWAHSTSAVVGYNIYRSGQPGGPYTKVNSALNATNTFFDMTVQAGQTHYYVATAVDGTGAESVYSNEIQLVIPYP